MAKLIGIAGRKGAGKDTAAAALVAEGFEQVAFAGPMKAMIGLLLSMQGVDDETIHRMLHGDLKEDPSAFLGGQTPRYALQTLGGDWGRKLMGDDFWKDIGLMRARGMMDEGDDVVITDVRHHNECDGIAAMGGLVARVYRPDRPASASDNHGSEVDIDDLVVSADLTNDAASPEEFVDKAYLFFKEMSVVQ